MRVSFDTNALIYLVQNVRPYAPVVESMIRSVREAGNEIAISVITEAEMMVKPLRDGDLVTLASTTTLMQPPVRLIDIDRETARRAAGIRARHRLKLEDSLIVASAISARCDFLVGNDRDCARRVTEIPYVYLENVVSGQ
jgi:predicted nucleic acid-binding protein